MMRSKRWRLVVAVFAVGLATSGPTAAWAAVGRGHGFDVAQATANLSVTLSDAPDPVAAGGTVRYTLAATNGGPGTSAGVSLILKRPKTQGLVYQAAGSTAGCVQAPEDPAKPSVRILCNRGPLAAGATTSVTLAFTATLAGVVAPVIGKAKLAFGEVDPVPTNNSVGQTTTVTPGDFGGPPTGAPEGPPTGPPGIPGVSPS